ncbi:MAG: DUF924 domain-containing protein [Gammaproteobacteria bacterium]|nr:DUF924 domain-containing protein [Gammaproteobacteria bacterium]
MQQVLSFWFTELTADQWFKGSSELDVLITRRFAALLEQAAAGELVHWRETAAGRLAEIIVLDQFSRNIYRNQAGAFVRDGMALALSQEAVRSGALQQLADENQRSFLLMPYMHSESAQVHEQAVPLFGEFASAGSYQFELLHKAIIDRFGRYPHRNEVLGRESTVEELEFLRQPGSSF